MSIYESRHTVTCCASCSIDSNMYNYVRCTKTYWCLLMNLSQNCYQLWFLFDKIFLLWTQRTDLLIARFNPYWTMICQKPQDLKQCSFILFSQYKLVSCFNSGHEHSYWRVNFVSMRDWSGLFLSSGLFLLM